MKAKYNRNKLKLSFSFIFLLCFLTSCKKLVEVDVPGNRISSGNVYATDATAIAVLNGLYVKLSSSNYNSTASIPNISMWAGLSADEFILWSGANSTSQISFYKNQLGGQSGGGEFWQNIYPYLYICNTAIEGLNASVSLTPAVKQQLLGEAKFMRAFFYFYLVNLYGDVPLVLSTDYIINSTITRSFKSQVYEQIINDLKEAQELLANGYVKGDGFTLYTSSAERVRPSKAAATALLARAYLYTNNDWANAEMQATSIINNTATFDTVALNSVFLKNSKEAIWQLQPVTTGAITNTAEAVAFIPTVAPVGFGSNHPVYLSSYLLNAFEPGDQRKTNGNWINVYTNATGTYYYPYKYKNVAQGTSAPTEYRMILRLAEQYLIRAEARAQLNNIAGAQNDLNVIRTRARLANTTANDKASLLTAILHERQVELFTELGQRWLDLKRTSNIDAVMTVVTSSKGNTWKSFQQLYPISQSELLKNPNLVQTTGY